MPWVFRVGIRAPANTSAIPRAASTQASGASSAERCPPFTSTAAPISVESRPAATIASSHPAGSRPASTASSPRFGVTTSARRSRPRSAVSASRSSSRSPLVEIITGSMTTMGGRTASSQSATSAITSAFASMPTFTASMPMSAERASSCARSTPAGGTWTPCTPRVFCTVSAVIAAMPYPPFAAIDLRSAWIPAPPEGSLPAMLSTRGTPADRQCRLNSSAAAAGSSGAQSAATAATPAAPASRRAAASSATTPPMATHGSSVDPAKARNPAMPSTGG